MYLLLHCSFSLKHSPPHLFLPPSFPPHSNHYYKELEVNARGTTWNLLLVKPYIDGGPAVCNGTLPSMCSANYTPSSRPPSTPSSSNPPVPSWDISSSLQVGVKVDGKLNDPKEGSKSWSVEMCLPLKEYVKYEEGVNNPPKDGDYWRINFSRVQWKVKVGREGGREVYVKDEKEPAANWVFQPIGVANMHLPERWGYAYFTEKAVNMTEVEGGGVEAEEGPRDPNWPVREALAQVYEAEKIYDALYGHSVSYTDSLNALVLNGHLSDHIAQGFCAGVPVMQRTGGGEGGKEGGRFEATVRSLDMPGVVGHVDEERRMWFTREEGKEGGEGGGVGPLPGQQQGDQQAVSKGSGGGQKRRRMLRQ